MFTRLFRKPTLEVLVDDRRVAAAFDDELPSEATPSVQIDRGSIVEFRSRTGETFKHRFLYEEGWAHLSVRVSRGFACQPDCVVSRTKIYTPELLSQGQATGVRFQPFLLDGASDTNEKFLGRGLFFRGLHYAGTVTPGYVSLGCVCEHCRKDFRLQSFHAGFSGVGYFYSKSSAYTLTLDEHISGAPPALGKADPEALQLLESRLPLAPDGTSFNYLNPLRCPHCAAPYVDFERFPEQREGEYYGNTLFGRKPIRYDEAS